MPARNVQVVRLAPAPVVKPQPQVLNRQRDRRDLEPVGQVVQEPVGRVVEVISISTRCSSAYPQLR